MEKIHVAVADEQEVFREGMRKVINSEKDMQCLDTFASLSELQVHVHKFTQRSIAVLLLVTMTLIKREGKEIVDFLKKRMPRLRVAVLTNCDTELCLARAFDAGLSGYLLKSTPLHDLIEAIRLINHGFIVIDGKVSYDILEILAKKTTSSLQGFCGLREREYQVLSLAASGMSNKMIAQRLNISPHTVANHFAHIFQKLSVESRTEAIALSLQRGWLDSERIQYLVDGMAADDNDRART